MGLLVVFSLFISSLGFALDFMLKKMLGQRRKTSCFLGFYVLNTNTHKKEECHVSDDISAM